VTVDLMTVTLQVPGALAAYAGGRREIEIAVPGTDAGAATTLAGVLDSLAGDLPALERRIRDERAVIRRHVNVYVDGTDIRILSGAETQVRDGATIDVIPAISGG
jgi:molybdopterin converting factor small subunit